MLNFDINRRKTLLVSALATGALLAPRAAAAAQASTMRKSLPKADMAGGKPLMQTLALRKSTRSFSSAPVSEQDLANILWAAWGVNRPNGMRTAPSARNRQNAEVYAVLEDGVWRYDAAAHELVQVLQGDQRGKFGGAPLTLLYSVEAKDEFAAMLAGSIYQNAGLYCASAGLANVVKATGRDALEGKFALPGGYKVVIIQSIGWPN